MRTLISDTALMSIESFVEIIGIIFVLICFALFLILGCIWWIELFEEIVSRIKLWVVGCELKMRK